MYTAIVTIMTMHWALHYHPFSSLHRTLSYHNHLSCHGALATCANASHGAAADTDNDIDRDSESDAMTAIANCTLDYSSK